MSWLNLRLGTGRSQECFSPKHLLPLCNLSVFLFLILVCPCVGTGKGMGVMWGMTYSFFLVALFSLTQTTKGKQLMLWAAQRLCLFGQGRIFPHPLNVKHHLCWHGGGKRNVPISMCCERCVHMRAHTHTHLALL